MKSIEPAAACAGTVATEIAAFRSYTVAHPIIKDVDRELRRAIAEPAGRSLIFVVGPTGVGKTTLLSRVAADLLPANGCSTAVVLEAAAPDGATFSWSDFYQAALITLNGTATGKRRKSAPGKPAHTIAHMRRTFEHAILERRPGAIFIDEAQHLAKGSSGRKLSDQMDSLKSLASLTHCVYVLIGTYELLPSRNLSAQLSRRSMDVHFRRYSARNDADVEAFQRVLYSFERALPLPCDPALTEDWEYYFAGCLGCIGILKDWLTRSLAQALAENAATLSRCHVDRAGWLPNQLEKMAQETLHGESVFEGGADARDRLRRMLGLTPHLGAIAATPAAVPELVLPAKKPSVGRRRPARDRVGAAGLEHSR